MGQTVKERTLEFIKFKNISMKEFEKRCGLSSGYVTSMRKGYGENKLNNVLHAFPDLNRDWLLYNEGDMLKSDTIKPITSYIQENLVYLDYVSVNAAASFVESMYDTVYSFDKYGVMPEVGEELGNDDIVFQIEGESMYPTIPNGSKILAKRIPEGMWESASGVVVVVYNKTLTVKRILKNSLFADNILTLKADNPTHGQVDVSRSEIRGMWKAIRIVSQKIL